LEPLEERAVPTIALTGVPSWAQRGPALIDFATVRLDPNNSNVTRNAAAGDLAVGSMNTVAVDPSNSSTLLAGATGGGIWRSTDGGRTWTARTDQFKSLFITDIEYNPKNSSDVFASTGNISSSYPGNFALFSREANGILRSRDGGVTWAQLNPASFGGRRLTRVVPTGELDSTTGRTILLAAAMDGGGIYRSTDGGDSWVSVLAGDPRGNTPNPGEFKAFAADLIRDPLNNGRYFAAVPGPEGGVFRSTDNGATWTPILPAGSAIRTDANGSKRILLALNSTATSVTTLSDNDIDASVRALRVTNSRAIPDNALLQIDKELMRVTAVSDTTNTVTVTRGVDGTAAVGHRANTNVVQVTFSLYAEVIGNNNRLTNLYRVSLNAGTAAAHTWTAVANRQNPFPGGQGNIHGAILADPSNPNRVYLSGDASQIYPFTGILYQVDVAAGTWTLLSLGKDNVTTLSNNNIEANVTTLRVANASRIPDDALIRIGTELMEVTGVNRLLNLVRVTRGVNDTAAVAHGGASPLIQGNQLLTTLSNNDIGANVTTLRVAGSNGIPNDTLLQIDNELMRVTAVDRANHTVTVTRGVNGTAAAAHGGTSAVIVVTNGASNTGPHADSRQLAWHGGNILEAGDGGLYELTQLTTSPRWTSVMGDLQSAVQVSTLQTTQLNSVALDTVHNSIIGGSQDNSTEFLVGGQDNTGTNSLKWQGSHQSGDGELVAVDKSTTNPWIYDSTQELGQFQRYQLATNAGVNSMVNQTNLGLRVFRRSPISANQGGEDGRSRLGNGDPLSFTTAWALDAAPSAQDNLVIGTRHLYESTNQGDDLIELLTPGGRNATTLTPVVVRPADRILRVADARAVPIDSVIRIGQEEMAVRAVDRANNTLTVIRGVNGTDAAAHNASSDVVLVRDGRVLTTLSPVVVLPDQNDRILRVANAAAVPVNSVIQIGQEVMVVRAVDPENNTLEVSRGVNNTDAAAHNASSDVVLKTPVQFPGTITAIAYGGALEGQQDAGVLYVGDDRGTIRRRTTGVGTGTFTGNLAPLGLTSVQGIALDPTDWRVAAVISQKDVYFTLDGGDDWSRITGRLNDPDLLSVEIARVGVNNTRVLLVGGSNGLYRLINPRASGNNPWTRYVGNLPNALPNVPVSSVRYYSSADTLLVGTFGRGAWVDTNASATLATASQLTITASKVNNTVTLRADPNNPLFLQVFDSTGRVTDRNAVPDGVFLMDAARIDVTTTGANAALFTDTSFGAVNPLAGIIYNGVARNNTLNQFGTPPAPFANETVTPNGPNAATINRGNNAPTTVRNVATIRDTVRVSGPTTFRGTSANDSIHVVDGGMVNGLAAAEVVSNDPNNPNAPRTFPTFFFADKPTVAIDTLEGDDTVFQPPVPRGPDGIFSFTNRRPVRFVGIETGTG
jgi:hypothetical protein